MTVAQAEAASEELRDHGIFSMLRAGLDGPGERRELVPAALQLLVAWLGFLAWVGPHVDSPVAAAVLRAAGRPVLLWAVPIALLATAAAAALTGRRGLARLGVMLAAYHGGTGLTGVAYAAVGSFLDGWTDAWWVGFAVRRALYGMAVCIPLAAAWWLLFRRRPPGFRWGVWGTATRMSRREAPVTWRGALGGVALTAGLPLFLLMQAAVGFEPITSGRLPALLVPILIVSLVNATVEEAIFRGFVLPAAVAAAGVPRGLWLVGLWFGLHHWGVSVQLLASLPGALLLGIGSVYFGKSVIETRGLAWAIAAHAVFDIAIFSAFYGRI